MFCFKCLLADDVAVEFYALFFDFSFLKNVDECMFYWMVSGAGVEFCCDFSSIV